jgi:hypothetical protein
MWLVIPIICLAEPDGKVQVTLEKPEKVETLTADIVFNSDGTASVNLPPPTPISGSEVGYLRGVMTDPTAARHVPHGSRVGIGFAVGPPHLYLREEGEAKTLTLDRVYQNYRTAEFTGTDFRVVRHEENVRLNFEPEVAKIPIDTDPQIQRYGILFTGNNLIRVTVAGVAPDGDVYVTLAGSSGEVRVVKMPPELLIYNPLLPPNLYAKEVFRYPRDVGGFNVDNFFQMADEHGPFTSYRWAHGVMEERLKDAEARVDQIFRARARNEGIPLVFPHPHDKYWRVTSNSGGILDCGGATSSVSRTLLIP